MSADRAYADPELAAVYDSLNLSGEDEAFYRNLPRPTSRILDVGCGTGQLALALAADGHAVTGIDPAPGMLAIARRKDTGGRVHWVEADGQDFSIPGCFDLAIMTGHVFQVFADDAEALGTLCNIRRHLETGGRFVFESRNPFCRNWVGWTREKTQARHEVPGIGAVEVHYQVLDVQAEHVTFESVFDFIDTGRQTRSLSRLRFPSTDQIRSLLERAGFSRLDWMGGWDSSPLAKDSPEIIVLAGV